MSCEASRTREEQLPEKEYVNWGFEIADFCDRERRRKMLKDLDEVLRKPRRETIEEYSV